jgi:hypothetical protein
MTERQDTPQAGVAGALRDLSEQTQALARHEIGAAVREMWEKARQEAPTAGLLAAAGVLGLCAAASSYRLSLRLLEKRLSPVAAALVATAGYGAGAACAAMLAVRRLREMPLPVPSDTARHASQVMAGAAAEAESASAPPAEPASAPPAP